jgi:tetratricopeptide (TPR) repeat protein
MKSTVFVYSFILTFVGGFTYMANFAHSQEIHSQRWDLRMMAERKIWKEIRLYYSRNPAERWPERKNRLQKIINQFPTSQWADDAALMLAGGQAAVDGNTESAIAALRQVMESYPSEHTIVVGWRTYMGCKLDYMWMLETVPLLSRPRSRPIRVDVPPSGQKREILAYFEHLEKYPRRTVDVAQLMIAQMLSSQGDVKGAIAELETIIDRTGDLRTIVAADNQLAKRPNAHLVKSHTPYAFQRVARPQYAAYIDLMLLYQSQSEVEKAIAIGLELANIASSDGREWFINEQMGNLLAQNGSWAKAEEQYQITLNGYRAYVERFIAEREASNAPPPPEATSWRQYIVVRRHHHLTILEKKLAEAKAKR